MSRDDPALREFYAATYSRLVGVVGAVTLDRNEAEEYVQDAFVRLVGQWSKVSRYEDPEAWVRKVALGYASNRRRKARNGARALLRLDVREDMPGPSVDAMALDTALTALPLRQREVLVLAGLGLTPTEIAWHLGVPVGTAKSRLARGRSALSSELREEVGRG